MAGGVGAGPSASGRVIPRQWPSEPGRPGHDLVAQVDGIDGVLSDPVAVTSGLMEPEYDAVGRL